MSVCRIILDWLFWIYLRYGDFAHLSGFGDFIYGCMLFLWHVYLVMYDLYPLWLLMNFIYACLSYPNFWPKVLHSYTVWSWIVSDFSVKNSAERYFKIPHFCSDSDPLLFYLYFFIYFYLLKFHLLLILFYFKF